MTRGRPAAENGLAALPGLGGYPWTAQGRNVALRRSWARFSDRLAAKIGGGPNVDDLVVQNLHVGAGLVLQPSPVGQRDG